MEELSQRAHSLFIRAKKGSSRSGEAGEILLYILNEWQLRAPQIVSKMYLKTNHNMPVHGTDGIHARYDDNPDQLFLYWGESKCHASLSSALTDALDSIKDFIEEAKENREIEIISQYADIESFDQRAKDAFLEYLDPYSEKSNERITVYSCLLVHKLTVDDNTDIEDREAAYIEEIKKNASNFVKNINPKIGEKGLQSCRFKFFIVPVPCVQAFRDKFQKKIGWSDD